MPAVLKALDHFRAVLPRKPYCTDDPRAGMTVRPRDVATFHRYVQANNPATINFLVQDIDRPRSVRAWEDTSLPAPNLSVWGDSDRPHQVWMTEPIFLTNVKAARLIGYVGEGFCEALGADPAYNGLLVKNPLHPDWRVEVLHTKLYSLAELAGSVDVDRIANENFRRGKRVIRQDGRNVGCFDHVRYWAYDHSGHFSGQHEWQEALLQVAQQFNAEFPVPMTFPEIRAIAKSVAKFMVSKYRGRSGTTNSRKGIMGLAQSEMALAEKQALSAQFAAARRRTASEARLARAVREGASSPEDAAQKAGLSRRSGYRHAKKVGTPTKAAEMEARRVEIERLRSQGMTWKAVAAALGLSEDTVKKTACRTKP